MYYEGMKSKVDLAGIRAERAGRYSVEHLSQCTEEFDNIPSKLISYIHTNSKILVKGNNELKLSSN